METANRVIGLTGPRIWLQAKNEYPYEKTDEVAIPSIMSYKIYPSHIGTWAICRMQNRAQGGMFSDSIRATFVEPTMRRAIE